MIELWVVAFSLILARAGTFIGLMPLFGGQNVPRLVKAGIAVALACPLFASYALVPPTAFAARFAEIGWLNYSLALAQEAILGAGMGYAFGLFLVPFRVAGEFISQEMGLSAAAQLDPTSNHPAGAWTEALATLGSFLFLGLDAHHMVLAVFYKSFARWPVGDVRPVLPTLDLVAGASQTQELGVLLAGPVVVCLVLATVVLGLMARTAPQMNIFSVGFALKVAVGFAAALVFLPDMVALMGGILAHVGETVAALLDNFA